MESNNRLKKVITVENLLCLFIIICPILDAASFIFRNYFNTSLSIATILRPIIPIIVIIYLFFKDKIKIPLIISGMLYGIYAVIHLYIFKGLITESSYGGITRELQYLVNYTFMIMNLFNYLYVFVFRKRDETSRKNNIARLRVAMLISFTIYIALVFIAILSGTSSHTYLEDQMGYKGWFESGNSVGAIMLLMLFNTLPLIGKENNKKIRIWVLIDIILSGIYLTTLLGTRVGLFGFLIVIFIYVVVSILINAYHNKKISKKIVTIAAGIFLIMSIVVALFGSVTLTRRKLLNEREDLIYDDQIGESAHVTGDILNIVKEINNNEIDEDYMSKETQRALIDLYNYNNEHKISYTNMRTLQFVYHTELVKEQKDIGLVLFGNGYMSHFYELIFEMEVPAFLYNFGIYGFILYFVPFFIITVYGVYIGIKYIKRINIKFTMSILSLCFAIAVSFLSGYTFFNSSAATTITTIATIVILESLKVKGEN